MTVLIKGGIADSDIIKGIYHQSSYVLVLEYKKEKYYAVLSPSDDEARNYMRKVPKKFRATIETIAKGFSEKIVFSGTGWIKGFKAGGQNLYLILATNHGTFSLAFNEFSALKLQEKSIGKDSLKDQPFDILLEF